MALKRLQHLPYEDISFAKIDHHRHLRQGVPEIIFAAGKTEAQVIRIARAMYKKSGSFLITKATGRIYKSLKMKGAVYHPESGVISLGGEKKKSGNIVILTAGTSDIPAAMRLRSTLPSSAAPSPRFMMLAFPVFIASWTAGNC